MTRKKNTLIKTLSVTSLLLELERIFCATRLPMEMERRLRLLDTNGSEMKYYRLYKQQRVEFFEKEVQAILYSAKMIYQCLECVYDELSVLLRQNLSL